MLQLTTQPTRNQRADRRTRVNESDAMVELLHTRARAMNWRTDHLAEERREYSRRRVESRITAMFAGPSRQGVLPLDIVDTSATGLGVTSTTELEVGTRVMLVSGNTPIPDRIATVVHCVCDDQGRFHMGLRYEFHRAA
ncbi:MAG: PilZ domain-containing protein [Phycisphaerales bacterium]|jgi:hypothetical protein|nr:PilZ domain-containing protein [Phycisphaeraceae bacterium]